MKWSTLLQKYYIFVLSFLSFIIEVHAQEGIHLETNPVFVRPNQGIRQPKLRAEGRHLGARVVISREQFEGTQQSLADVLQQVPGLAVSQTGNALSETRVSIRGSRSNQVLVLVDGVALNRNIANPSTARAEGREGVNLAAIPLDQVESIEVIRGAASAEYGAGAAAGAILIKTRLPEKEQWLLEMGVGSSEYRKYHLAWSHPFGEDILAVDASHQSTSGEYLFYDQRADENRLDRDLTSEQCTPKEGSGFRRRECNRSQVTQLKIDWERHRSQRWGLELSQIEQEGLGGIQNIRPDGKKSVQQTILRYQESWWLNDTQELGLKTHLFEARTARVENDQQSSLSDNTSTERRGEIDSWMTFWWDWHQWHIGIVGQTQRVEDEFFDQQRDQQALYTSWEASSPQTIFEVTWRYEGYSDLESQSTEGLSLNQYWSKSWGSKFSYGHGYRPPSLYELYDSDNPQGPSPANPELKAEQSFSYEAGFFWEQYPKFYAEWLYFKQKLNDHILAIADSQSPSLFRFQNIAQTETDGFEMLLSWRFEKGWSLDGSWTQMKPRIVDNDKVDKRDNGNQVPGVPESQRQLSVQWHRNDWGVYVTTRYSDRRFINTANTRFLKAYQLLDTGLQFPIHKQWSGALDIHNLTNESYAELENFPPPGRQIFLTLRVKG